MFAITVTYISSRATVGEVVVDWGRLSFVGDLGVSLLSLDGGDLVVAAVREAGTFEGLATLVRDSVVDRLDEEVVGVMVDRRSLVAVGRVADGLVVVEEPKADIRFETPLPTPGFFSSPDVTEASGGASGVLRGPRPALLAVVDDTGRVGGLFSVLPGAGRVDEVEDDFGVEDGFVLAVVELLCEVELPAADLLGTEEAGSLLELRPRRTAGVLVESAIMD